MASLSTPRRVYTAVELDDAGAAAVRWADSFASALGVDHVVAAAFENPSSEKPPGAEDEFLDQAGERLDAWLADLGVRPTRSVALEPDLEHHLVKAAKSDDVVVVGGHHHEGATKWAIGSEPHELAKELDGVLVLVPTGPTANADAPVLVGLDGTKANRIVAEWSTTVAAGLGRPVTGLFATDPMYDTFDNAGNYGKEEVRARAEADEAEISIIEKQGPPDGALRSAAGELDAYLTVVGAREHHSFGGMVLGKVVDHLIHESAGPLAILTHDYLESHLD